MKWPQAGCIPWVKSTALCFFPFPTCISFISFSFLIALAKISSTVLLLFQLFCVCVLLLKSSWLTILSLYFLRLPFLYGLFSLSPFSFRLMSGTGSSSVSSYDLLYNLVMSPYASTHICMYGGGGLVTKSCLTLSPPWTVAHQDPRSLGFPRQEYWSGLPFPSLGYLPNPGSPNLGLLHCRQILYQMSYKGSPICIYKYTHKLSILSGSSNYCEEPD